MTTVGLQEILKGLRALGIDKGATLLVHSSLSSFGHVENGAHTVIEALLEAVGPAGNIVMPTLSFRSVDETIPYFSMRDTPSETGRISEVFRHLPQALRSRHPLSSASATGPEAARLTEGKQLTPCGVDSPYYGVYDLEGFSLFLGAGFRSNSLFHVAEELVCPSYMSFKKLENVKIRTAQGKYQTDTFWRYDCRQNGIVRKLEKMEAIYRDRQMVRQTRVGPCTIMLIPARDNVDVASEVLQQRPEYIL